MDNFKQWIFEREGFSSETLFHEMAVQSPNAQAKIKNAFDFVNRHHLGCVLIGGMAVAHYVSRAITPDVDFMCPSIPNVVNALEAEGLNHSPLILAPQHEEGGIMCPELDADFLDAHTGNVAMNNYILSHATEALIGGFNVPIIDPSVLLIQKFVNGRPKDLEDAFKLLPIVDKRSLKSHLQALKRNLGDEIDAKTIWSYAQSLG